LATLLVNRAEPEASATAGYLRQHGHEPVLAPCYSVHFLPLEDTWSAPHFTGVLLTSRNAVRAWNQIRTSDTSLSGLDVPLFAVGSATADLAEKLIQRPAIVSDGDGKRLGHAVAASFPDGGRHFLHPTGSTPASGLYHALEAGGHSVDTLKTYDIEPVTFVPDQCRASLVERTLDGVLYFSARSADLAMAQMRTNGLIEPFVALTAYCLSERVANRVRENYQMVLPNAHVPRIHVADRPALDALLALVEGHLTE